MHALSPQMMVLDTSGVGITTPPSDIHQAQIVAASGYSAMVPSFRVHQHGMLPHIYAGQAGDAHGIVWIKQPHYIPQEHCREDHDTNGSGAFVSSGLVPGQLPLLPQQQNLIQFMPAGAGNGQMVNSGPIQALTPQQIGGVPLATRHFAGNFLQVPESAPASFVHHQPDGVHFINLASIGQHHHQSSILGDRPGGAFGLPTVNLREKSIGIAERPRLTPRRRGGMPNNNHCDNVSSWRRVSDDRSLGGNNTAVRRRSQSADIDSNSVDTSENNSVSPTPNKRAAPTLYPVAGNCDFSSELWRAPDCRTMRKLIDIIEYYFSDECLTKNGYMLKQLSDGNGDGYISLRRVASLKKVKSQTRDVRTVAYAVRQSMKLETNEDGTMIRRKRPLPDNIEAPRFIRSVLAINLPKDNPSVEDVTSLFAPFGDLTQVRVLRPGKTLPPYLKDYTAWVPDLGTRVCAVVEFENQDEAQKACREINMQNRGNNSLRVALLKPGARIRRTLYRKYKDGNQDGQELTTKATAESAQIKSDQDAASLCNRSRCSSESSDYGTAEREAKIASNTNNNLNNNKAMHRYHYDASGSGSDSGSDTDSIDRKSTHYKMSAKTSSEKVSFTRKSSSNSPDSGYSHSSSDERDSLIMSPPLKSILITNRSVLSSDSNGLSHGRGSSSNESSSPVRRHPIEKNFIDGVPVGVTRQPKGPTPEGKGFYRQSNE